jgi:flagella basal body P-ring formation protein FlgA
MSILKTLAPTLALALGIGLAGSAFAAPSLRADVTVTSEIVTVGDMFDDAGAFAELALFRAPQPGTTGIVSLEAVRRAGALVGLTEFENVGVARVRVARAATVVDADMLDDLILRDLGSRGIIAADTTPSIRFNNPSLSYNAEAVADPVQLLSLRYAPNGEFSARFHIAGTDVPVDIDGRLDLMVEVPHLVGLRPAGTVLSATDIEMKLVPLKTAEAGGFATLDQLVGKALQRQSRGGVMLRPGDVSEPLVVERNQMVTVYFRAGAMTLTVKGQALGNASAGEAVQVLNTTSKKILTGTALANGGVDLTSTLNVAGL